MYRFDRVIKILNKGKFNFFLGLNLKKYRLTSYNHLKRSLVTIFLTFLDYNWYEEETQYYRKHPYKIKNKLSNVLFKKCNHKLKI